MSDPTQRTACVLGGGGLLGAVEVGMLRALFEAGIRPDLILGTSVGALNGALVAADPGPGVIERLVGLWESAVSSREVYGDGAVRQVTRAVRTGTHLHSTKPLRDRLAQELRGVSFEELAVPSSAAPPASSAPPSTGSPVAAWSTRSWPVPPCPGCCRRPGSATSTTSTAAS